MPCRVREQARLVDAAKAHLVVVRIDRVGAIAERVTPSNMLDATPDEIIAPEPMTLAIAYEDDDLVAIDKPAGMHVHPLGAFRTATVLNQLLGHAGARADEPW